MIYPSQSDSASASRGAVFSALPDASQKAPLVSNVQLVDTVKRKANRKARQLSVFAAKNTAAQLLRSSDSVFAKRISDCSYVAYQSAVDLVRQDQPDGDASASFKGVVSCRSVFCCPVCSPRISAGRRDEVNVLLATARAKGCAVVMLTLTFRHNRKMPLASSVVDLKSAQKRLRQSRGWRGLNLVGSVAALEVTHGQRNGWHPHTHMIMILPVAPADALAAVEGLRAEWLRSLGKVGLSGNDAAFQVQAASAAGEYVASFGAAEELTLGHNKAGRGGSRSPWQLLSDARDGDKQACALWIEYALAFKGKHQLHWSRGLKDWAGVNEVSDYEISVSEPVQLRVWDGASDCWRLARRRRCALVAAAESGGNLDAAEFGPTDAERWRCELAEAQVLE